MTLAKSRPSVVSEPSNNPIHGVLSLACVVASLLLCACDTTTGTKTELRGNELSQLKSLGVEVILAEPFSVTVARETLNGDGYYAGGIPGTLIQRGLLNSTDSATTKKLQPLLAGLDCQGLMSERLVKELQQSGRFRNVQALSVQKTGSADAILRIQIAHWGLRSGGNEATAGKAQVALDARAALVREGVSRPMWERGDYVTGGNVHTLDSFGSADGLLQAELKDLCERYATRIANEIRYSR